MIRRLLKRTIVAVLVLDLTSMAPAHTPAKGAAERRAILDAVRPAVEAKIGPNVEFVISDMQVEKGWALVLAKPQRKGGGKIDWRRYYDPAEWDHMDGLDVSAVLQFRNRRWNLIDYSIGATDAWYCGLRAAPVAFLKC